MSSMMSSRGVVLATAMAVSGTVILLVLRLQKSLQFPPHQISHQSSPPITRSCISSDGKRSDKKKQKRVHFAEDMVDLGRDGRGEVRRNSEYSNSEKKVRGSCYNGGSESRGMPANRAALYNSMF